MEYVLEVNNLTKKFLQKKKQSAFIILKKVLKNTKTKPITVLKNVSFKLKKGEMIGLIGSNGSGKSTLIKIISSIYELQSGQIKHNNKKITSIIGLETGMNRIITVKENIHLIASLYGLSIKQIRKKFSSIVKFSDLKNYLNIPVYQLSAGMRQRLAFSIAIHVPTDILLLDEILTVGDISFREKSIIKLNMLIKKGLAVIFISHELTLIENHCNKTIWLDKGKIRKIGESKKIIKEYKQHVKKNN